MKRRIIGSWLALLLCGAGAVAGPLVEQGEVPRPIPELPAMPGPPPSAARVPAFASSPSSPDIALAVPSAETIGATPDAQTASAAAPAAARDNDALAIPGESSAAQSIDDPSASFDGARRFARQGAARAVLLAQRAATLPAHLWPFTRLAEKLSHGEGLAGLTPAAAVRTARRIRSDHGAGTVVGRLSWELHDVWSVRGAVRSYARLIEQAAAARSKEPGLDISVSLDVEALGAQLDGLPSAERTRIAKANALGLARRARDLGVPIEFDMGASALMPLLIEVARCVVRELGMPARLALAARYLASEEALRDWAALARAMGLRLGVRLVKGSFIEGDRPGTLYFRRALLAQYKKLVTQALTEGGALDVAVATHNEEIWDHAASESRRLGAGVSFQTIRGVNPEMQARMRRFGNAPREYVSYGVDTPVMALMEWWTNWRQKRALRRRVRGELD